MNFPDAYLRLRRVLLVALLLPAAAQATVSLPALFSTSAVLQRDKPLPIWGWGAPGESVTVTLWNQSATTVTGPDSRWRVELGPQPVSTQPLTLTVAGSNTLTVTNVLLGDVWLCSGQSNMAMSVGGLLTPESKVDYQTANYPLIRQMGVEVTPANSPQENVTGQWLVCTPAKASQFSAVGFYFAIKVHQQTGVPIGILRSAKGSTIIECWTAEEPLMHTLGIEPHPTQMRNSLALWETEKSAALAAGIPADAPEFPEYPFSESVKRPRCVTHYNGMIAPLARFALRGAIWYQGETNAVDLPLSQAYTRKLRTLIASWRTLFGDPNLPFYIVQLPNYLAPTSSPAGGDRWSWMREAQRQCLAIPDTRLAVTIDIGEELDIHPKNKFDVGERLGLLALKHEYGQTTLVASGPVFRNMVIEANKARLNFASVGSGLMTGIKTGRGPAVEDPGATLGRFAIAGSNNQWYWANAVIDGDTVLVSATEVSAPVAVRYAYSTNPAGANLYNRNGLPAAPFATDAVIIPVTGAPTISDVPDQSVLAGVTTGPLAFVIGDGQTPASALTLTKRSGNPSLVPDENILIGGSGANRTVTVTPLAGQTGSATLTVAVSDGTFSTVDTFIVSISTQALQLSGWTSVNSHDSVPSALAIPAGGLIEPRNAGIRRVEVAFSAPITLANPANVVTVTGVNKSGTLALSDLGISANASAVANTLIVTFSNSNGACALPDASKWKLALVPTSITGADGSVLTPSPNTTRLISSLRGDSSADGRTTGIDLNHIQAAANDPPLLPVFLRADIDGDGAITPADQAAAWTNRSQTIDSLPTP